ncbi:MAG: DUF4416 family protein [Planctomycetes bacterium]|nr:DUF4416 family protein [Planctomycetota bacterium]
MGQPSPHAPVVRLVAVITRHAEALSWAEQTLAAAWGPIALRSPTFDFAQTDYYTSTMGAGLGKTFLAFERLVDPGELVEWKYQTNAWEDEFAALGRHPEPRPLNLDSGYISPAKLVLASTKDHAHRIYLGRGMYAEITLFYKHKAWRDHEYTFPDYRRADYHAFFDTVRRWLRAQAS